MNLQENIQRIKEMMGLKETIDVPSDSYITMNIKNFPRYKEELAELLKDKLIKSNGNFVKFKNSVVTGYGKYGVGTLSYDLLQTNNRYLNRMVSMGSKTFNSLLYNIFSEFYNKEETKKTQSNVSGCDPTNFKIFKPMVAKDDKTFKNYHVQVGAKLYLIKLPDECLKDLTPEESKIVVVIEPNENRIHFPTGVPQKLRGKKLGTLIYLEMIKKLGYITSSVMNSSDEIKMIYEDLLKNPKYNDKVMSLLLPRQVILFDKDTNEDVKKIFNEFVSNKFANKKTVRISPDLKEILGDDFTTWYDNLDSYEETTQDKIKKYEGLEPKGGDTVVDTTTGRIYTFYGEWGEEGKKQFRVTSDEYETLLLPSDEKKRFKVIHRQYN